MAHHLLQFAPPGRQRVHGDDERRDAGVHGRLADAVAELVQREGGGEGAAAHLLGDLRREKGGKA